MTDLVLAEETLLGADSVLHRELKYTADQHAPVKTVQLRKGYLPALSDQTKELMEVRNQLRASFRSAPDPLTLQQLKESSSTVRKAVRADKVAWASRNIIADPSSKGVWRTARSAMGQTTTKAPTCLEVDGEVVSNPHQMA